MLRPLFPMSVSKFPFFGKKKSKIIILMGIEPNSLENILHIILECICVYSKKIKMV